MGQKVEGEGDAEQEDRNRFLYLEQGSLCWVQLGVALNLWVHKKINIELCVAYKKCK